MNRVIRLTRVPRTFCEGPFWGSGLMGSILYMQGENMHLTVDHPLLWEMRETLPDTPKADYETILQNREAFFREEPEVTEATEIFDRAIGRTRLPALHLAFPVGNIHTFLAETDLRAATSHVMLRGEKGAYAFSVFLDSVHHVLHLDVDPDVLPLPLPTLHAWDLEDPAFAVLKRWGYAPSQTLDTPGALTLRQVFSGDSLALMQLRESGDSLHLAVAVEIGKLGEEEALLRTLSERTRTSLADAGSLAAHISDWARFWDASSVTLPDPLLQEAYDLEMYKLYCNERPYGLPVTLQGIWNPDTRMPPWYGDLHNDLNVQSCYWSAYKTNHASLARAYIDTYTAAMGRFRERAEKLFHLPDAIHVPTMMAPDGTGAASEWCFWNTVLGPELFVAVDFVWYYAFTLDEARLKGSILPMVQSVLNLYLAIAREDADGKLHIPFTFSPEVNCMHPDSTFTLASLHYLCAFYARMADAAGLDPCAYADFDARLALPEADEEGYPLYAHVPVYGSHRHFCQMYPVFPLGTDIHSPTAERSLDTIVNHGMLEYAAFSFPYAAIFASRTGRGNMARTMNHLYCLAFRSPNSFTVNGDPYRNGLLTVQDALAGESTDAFTLESGFFIPTSVSEMLVHRGEKDLYLFFGLPDDWQEAAFSSLLIEGGHTVSAEVKADILLSVRIVALCDETLTVHVLPRLVKGDGTREITLRRGEEVTLTQADFGGNG
ncbi:MAG: hypothetical protein IJ708_07540 [Clostridia bacterium]|nr:hypothetical protein [Clostridia bacterium]